MTEPDRALLLLTARHVRNALNFLCRHDLTEDDRQELRNYQHDLTDAIAQVEEEPQPQEK